MTKTIRVEAVWEIEIPEEDLDYYLNNDDSADRDFSIWASFLEP